MRPNSRRDRSRDRSRKGSRDRTSPSPNMRGLSNRSPREEETHRALLGVRNYEEYKQRKMLISELEMVAQNDKAKNNNGILLSNGSVRSSLENELKMYGKSPEVIAQQARSQLVTRRKMRIKPVKNLADIGQIHPKLHVVQKKHVIDITADQEYEMDVEEVENLLASQKLLEEAYGAGFEDVENTVDGIINGVVPNCGDSNSNPSGEQIHKIYEKNRAWKLHDQLKTPKEFLDKVTKSIPLNELYEVLDYIYIGQDQTICPVLLEIKDKDLRNQENGTFPADQPTTTPDDKEDETPDIFEGAENEMTKGGKEKSELKYLLQVWRRADGLMLYERKLGGIPKGWGLTGEKFFYQENDSEDDVFEIYMLDTAENTTKIYKIILPEDIRRVQKDDEHLTDGLKPSLEFNEVKEHQKRTKVHHALDDSEKDVTDEHLPSLQNEANQYLQQHDNRVSPLFSNLEEDELDDQHFRAVPKYFKEALAWQNERLTEKMNKMVKVNLAYIHGRVIMATKYAMIELKINKLVGPDAEEPTARNDEDVDVSVNQSEDRNEKVIFADSSDRMILKLEKRHIKKVAIYGEYMFQRFIDIGLDRTAMIIENNATNQIRFMLLTTQDVSNKVSKFDAESRKKKTPALKLNNEPKQKQKICFKVLGIHQALPKTDVYGMSKILTTCTATFRLNFDDSSDINKTGVQNIQESAPVIRLKTEEELKKDEEEKLKKRNELGQADVSDNGASESPEKRDHLPSIIETAGEQMTSAERDRSDQETPGQCLTPNGNLQNQPSQQNLSQAGVSEAHGEAIEMSSDGTHRSEEQQQEAVSQKTKQEQGKITTVTLILRENGKVEVYSDFELAETFNLAFNNKHLFCVDIQADDENFYFKFLDLNNSKPKEPNMEAPEPKYVIRTIQQAWRRRIAYKNTVATTANWTSLKMKNLNHFMRLYSQWETFMGHFLVAHRGYISVYNLKDATKNKESDDDDESKKKSGLWVQHLKITGHFFIRELVMLKKDMSVDEYDTVHLRCHSKPFVDLNRQYIFGVISGRNCITKLQLTNNGKLQPIISSSQTRRQEQIDTLLQDKLIISHNDDKKYSTGTIVKVICGRCNEDGSKDPVNAPFKRSLYTYKNLYSGEKGDDVETEPHEDHLVMDDALEKAKKRCKSGKCLQMYIFSYDEMSLIYEYKPNQKFAIQSDCFFQIIRASRSFWKQHIFPELQSQCDVMKFIQDDENDGLQMEGLLLYKKNEYLRLIPFLGKLEKFTKTLESVVQVPGALAKIHKPGKQKTLEVQIDMLIVRRKIYLEHGFDLLDKKKLQSVLGDQDLLVFRVVGKKQAMQYMPENSFMILTKNQINVFDDQQQEVGRITGLQISGAFVIDARYLYVMQDTVSQIYEQYTNIDKDYILEPKKELKRSVVGRQGFMRINFENMYNPKAGFAEIFIKDAATGQNGIIRRNHTTDVLSIMCNLHVLQIVPIPNMSMTGFTGIHSKNNYLVWKQSSDGFFTALSRRGNVITWSTVTGDILYHEHQTEQKDCNWASLAGYTVYRSDIQDETYTGNYYNNNSAVDPDKSHSISLLVSSMPVHKERTLSKIEECRDYKCCGEIEEFDEVADEAVKQRKQMAERYHAYIRQSILAKTASDDIGFDDDYDELPPEMFQREEIHWSNRPGKPRVLSKKMLRSKLYHFQVIKLRQYEDELRSLKLHDPDNKDKVASGSTCVRLFHFFHKLMDRYEPIADFDCYDWYLSEHNLKQRLYLSRSTETTLANRMLEVIQNRLAIVWCQDDNGQSMNQGQLVDWVKAYDIPKFPFLAAEISSLPYFISDDFSFLVEYDYRGRRLRLNYTSDGTKIGELPQEAIFMGDSIDERRNAREAYTQVSIHGHDKIITENQETGVRSIWPVKRYKKKRPNIMDLDNFSGDEYDFKVKLKQARCIFIDKFLNTKTGHNLIEEPMAQLTKIATTQRLMQLNTLYTYAMKQRIVEETNLGKNINQYWPDVLSPLLAIDFTQQLHNPMSSFQIDRTFSWLDWAIAMTLQEKAGSFCELMEEEQLRMCLNIFPGGNSFMKMMTDSGNWKPEQNLELMFKAARRGMAAIIQDKQKLVKLEVPLIVNSQGLVPLDYACGMYEHVLPKGQKAKNSIEEYDTNQCHWPIVNGSQIAQSKNITIAQVIFSAYKDGANWSSAGKMVEPIIFAIGVEIPQVFDYLDSRLRKTTSHIKSILNTDYRPECRRNSAAWGDYGLTKTQAITYSKITQEKLFVEEKKNNAKQKQLYEYYFFDVPQIYFPCEKGYKMMDALQQTDNISTFSHPSVQIMIVNHWEHWRLWNNMLIMLPLGLLVTTFSIQSCVLMPNLANVDERIVWGFELANIILATYFFIIISLQAIGVCQSQSTKKGNYAGDLFLSLLTPILIISCQMLIYFQHHEGDQSMSRWFWELTSWTAFCLWVFVLRMLRSVESLSGTIGMIFECLKKSTKYIVVVICGVLCFTNAFQAIRQILYNQTANYAEDDQIKPPFDRDMDVSDFWDFKDKWLGEYIKIWGEIFVGAVIGLELDNAKGFSDTQMILFFVCVIFNTIVLMNLLLAVVAAVQSETSEMKKEFFYHQVVNQICFMQRVFFRPQKVDKRDCLFLAKACSEVVTKTTVTQLNETEQQYSQLNLHLTQVGRQIEEIAKSVNQKQNQEKKPQTAHEGFNQLMTSLQALGIGRGKELGNDQPALSKKNSRQAGILSMNQRMQNVSRRISLQGQQ